MSLKKGDTRDREGGMAIRLVSLVQNARYNDATDRPMSLKLNIFLGFQFNHCKTFCGNPRGKMEMSTVMI